MAAVLEATARVEPERHVFIVGGDGVNTLSTTPARLVGADRSRAGQDHVSWEGDQ